MAGVVDATGGLDGFLDGAQAVALEHAELETHLQQAGRELFRQLMQDHLQLRAQREQRLPAVIDAEQVTRDAVETGHTRALTTVFGEVRVARLAYRRRGHANLYPADAALNLPAEKHSHGLRQLAALEAARGSFDDTAEAIERATGVRLGKRQAEALAGRAAVDIDDFYAQRQPQPAGAGREVLVLSADGKGIVMRPEALRPATAKAAATTKLSTRLSKGEKRNRKRLAEVGAVYDADPVVRTPADILARSAGHRGEDTDPEQPAEAPAAKNKWLTASVTDDAATVVGRLFDEADRRDPTHARTWIALVDGNNHQIDRIQAEATQRGVNVTILCDFIHVLEYLWKAVGWPSWSFHQEGDPAAEEWVHDQGDRRPAGQGHPSRRRPPPRRHPSRAGPSQARRCRRLRHLPDQQGALPGLSDRAAQRLADRHRRHRRRLPAPRQRPHGHHRSPLGPIRRRGHPQAPSPPQQRRLRHLLAPTTSHKNAAASTKPATSTDIIPYAA